MAFWNKRLNSRDSGDQNQINDTTPAGEPTGLAWKSRPIFLSSTFRDMHAERDFLRDHAFLRLAEQLRERCHYLETIDLRQGVETNDVAEEAVREMQVLKVCLDEIERSQPFFVALLGERYGWVPPTDRITAAAHDAGLPETVDIADKSVTELEILYGALENQDQRRRSWFYFRTLDRSGMPPEIFSRFPAEEPNDNPDSPAGKLAALKNRIREEMPDRVRDYTLRWDPRKQALAGLEVLDDLVARDLWADLDIETAGFLREAPRTWQEADARAVADFAMERTRGYVKRPAVTTSMLDHALSSDAPDAQWGMVVTGESGSGKSSLFGAVFNTLQARAAVGDIVLISHAAGIFPLSGQVDRMLRRWVRELADLLGLPDPLEKTETDSWVKDLDYLGRPEESPITISEQIEKTFAELLGQVASQIRVVVLIDALDQFETTVRAMHLNWLPKEWPANARLVATAIPCDASMVLEDRALCVGLPVQPVNREEAAAIAEKFYRERHHRDVNLRVLDALLDKELPDSRQAHGNPLWLSLALQEMNNLEADDFERADREFAHLDGAARMEALQLAETNKLPGDVPGMYGELIDRAERNFGKAWTGAFMDLLVLGRAGWRESDLRVLMPKVSGQAWDDLSFAGLRRAMGTHVVQRGAHAQWDFFHGALRRTILSRDLADEKIRRRLHGLLADHLECLAEFDPLRISETMVHLIGLGDRDRAAGYIATIQSKKRDTSDSVSPMAEAVSVMVEALQAASSNLERERITEWIASLMGGDDERSGKVARAFIFSLNDALKITGAVCTEVPRHRLLEAAQSCLEELRARYPQDLEYAQDLSSSYSKLGELHFGMGNGDRALEFCEEGLKIAERLYMWNPQDLGCTRHLTDCCVTLGDMHRRMGNSDREQEFYEKGLKIAEELHTRNPRSVNIAMDLGACCDRIGMMHSRLGNVDRAQSFYKKALELAEDLRAWEPQRVDIAQNLSVAYDRLGDVYRDLGNSDQELSFREKALKIRENMRAWHPQDALCVRLLRVSYNKLGHVHRDLGNGDRALEFYKKALKIAEDLNTRNPQSAEYSRDLSDSYYDLGREYFVMGNSDQAQEFYGKALEVAEDLHRRNPQNVAYTGSLSHIYNGIGSVYKGLGNVDRALAFYKKALKIREDLRARDPYNLKNRQDLSESYIHLGDVHRDLGNLDQALAFYKMALEIGEDLRVCNSQTLEYAFNLSICFNRLGDVHRDMRNIDRAQEFYKKALEILVDLRMRNPQSAKYAHELSVIYERAGDSHRDLCNGNRAQEFYKKSLEIREDLRVRYPRNAQYARDLAVSYEKLGDLYLFVMGNGDGVLEFYQKALEIYEDLNLRNEQSVENAKDLYTSYSRMAILVEQTDGSLAQEWWRKACEQVSGLKQRGMFILSEEEDDQLLTEIRRKVDGFKKTVVAIPSRHPKADPERAFKLNMQYQQELSRWKALPWWKRIRTPKPEAPKGI